MLVSGSLVSLAAIATASLDGAQVQALPITMLAAQETGAPPADASAPVAAPPVAADGSGSPEAAAAEGAPVPDPALADAPAVDADGALIDGRRRPGVQEKLPERVTQENVGAVRPPPPEAFPVDQIPVPDRWRLIESLGVVKERWFDPYNQNVLKGDRPLSKEKMPAWLRWLPIKGDDWFFIVNAVSDTIVEPRSFPLPVGVQTTERPDSNDLFGRANSFVAAQTFITGVSLVKGSTAYKPPDIEYRLTLAFQENFADVSERRILFVQPSRKSRRLDGFVGVQEAFIDKHLRNVSDRYDFDSVRVGIQPFQADFRGFLFNDNQLGIRLFGNRDNNRYQYNLAAFWRLEKDTNSGLNDVTRRPRDDAVFFANVFAQDFPFPGLTSQVSATYNLNREGNDPVEIDDNGFPVRPALLGSLRGRSYDVVYLGYSNDGRIGRLNLTSSTYFAFGKDRDSIFTGKPANIRAFFSAAEASYDVDWMRFRLSGLYASGDSNPYDNKETGFDAIFENPIFAGADTSYWIRQTIPFAGGGRAVGLNGRNGILASLRSSKEQGQSNFNNPGTMLLGVGADFDVLPQFRISTNVNHLWFENTATLKALRNEGSIPREIGWDVSAAAIYRPNFIQNSVFRLSAAVLDPGKGFSDLFTNNRRDDRYYSVLLNVILSF